MRLRCVRTHSPHTDVVVTDGTGCIGGHLAEAFAQAGHDVTGLDDLAPSDDMRITERTIEICEDAAATDGTDAFVDGDVRDADLVAELVGDAEVSSHQPPRPGSAPASTTHGTPTISPSPAR